MNTFLGSVRPHHPSTQLLLLFVGLAGVTLHSQPVSRATPPNAVSYQVQTSYSKRKAGKTRSRPIQTCFPRTKHQRPDCAMNRKVPRRRSACAPTHKEQSVDIHVRYTTCSPPYKVWRRDWLRSVLSLELLSYAGTAPNPPSQRAGCVASPKCVAGWPVSRLFPHPVSRYEDVQ